MRRPPVYRWHDRAAKSPEAVDRGQARTAARIARRGSTARPIPSPQEDVPPGRRRRSGDRRSRPRGNRPAEGQGDRGSADLLAGPPTARSVPAASSLTCNRDPGRVTWRRPERMPGSPPRRPSCGPAWWSKKDARKAVKAVGKTAKKAGKAVKRAVKKVVKKVTLSRGSEAAGPRSRGTGPAAVLSRPSPRSRPMNTMTLRASQTPIAYEDRGPARASSCCTPSPSTRPCGGTRSGRWPTGSG